MFNKKQLERIERYVSRIEGRLARMEITLNSLREVKRVEKEEITTDRIGAMFVKPKRKYVKSGLYSKNAEKAKKAAKAKYMREWYQRRKALKT